MKICSKCGEEKELDQFNINKMGKYGKQSFCRNCSNKHNKEYAKEHKQDKKQYQELHKIQRQHRERYNKYKITSEEYINKLIDQQFVCAICGNSETRKHPNSGVIYDLSVDHCHKTNKIRGLLCNGCNVSIGKFNHNIDILQSAIDYLKQYE